MNYFETRTGYRLLINIKNSIKAIQNPRYAHKAQNLKRAAKTLNFLTEQGIDSYSTLVKKHTEAKKAFDQTRTDIKNSRRKSLNYQLL